MIKSLSRKPGFALAALAVAVATAAPAVSAQEKLEEVIVTGSRIPVDSNAVSSVPIQAYLRRTSVTRVKSTLPILSLISPRLSLPSLQRTHQPAQTASTFAGWAAQEP